MELKVEFNQKFVEENTTFKLPTGAVMMVTPPLDDDYWLMRVPLSATQAVVCFPKFGTIGIGFQREDYDWNTNLPWQCGSHEIYNHIKCNKGDGSISWRVCIRAIELLQDNIRVMVDD